MHPGKSRDRRCFRSEPRHSKDFHKKKKVKSSLPPKWREGKKWYEEKEEGR